jgi:hypothetical protein
MPSLQKLSQLSGHHCVLLAVEYATASNIKALRALTTLREADLPLELTLSILLTFLPEELEPSAYIEYLNELATDSPHPGEDPTTVLDTASVEELSAARAKKRRKTLELLPVVRPPAPCAVSGPLRTPPYLVHSDRSSPPPPELRILPTECDRVAGRICTAKGQARNRLSAGQYPASHWARRASCCT